MSQETLRWFAGVDWGSERHQARLLDADGAIIGERAFVHSGAGLAELADWLLSLAGEASTVAMGIEVPHGPVVDTLVDRGFVVHAINPKQLDRLRDRFSVAGAKDDRRYAYVLGDGVRTDRRLFHRLHVADPRLVELRAWSRLGEELKEERRRLCNRVGQQLWRYCPQMQKLTDDLAAPWFLELCDHRADAGEGTSVAQANGRAGAAATSHPPPGCRHGSGGLAGACDQGGGVCCRSSQHSSALADRSAARCQPRVARGRGPARQAVCDDR